MKKPGPAKTLAFRFPLAKKYRGAIANCRPRPGTSAEKLPPDSLVVTGTWTGKEALAVDPVFPGTMRFIAADKTKLPKPADVVFDGDQVQPAYLRGLGAIVGTLIVEIQPEPLLKAMRKAGMIPVAGIAPAIAFYGPVFLGERFLRESLLDPKGLDPGKPADKKKLPLGSKAWRAKVLADFLSGDYHPMLHAGAALKDDDAGRLPMPSVTLGTDFAGQPLAAKDAFALAMTFAAKDAGTAPTDPMSAELDTAPAAAFLRHVARSMREPVLSRDGADPVLEAVLEGEDTSQPWATRLLAALSALGFGAKAGAGDGPGKTPADTTVREFQLAASQIRVAKLIDPAAPPAQAALRDFRHLQQVPNPDPYKGFPSGLADRRTRALIADWARAGLRNPLLMPVFLGAADKYVAPAGDPVVGAEDVWNRREMEEGLGRVFAADFSRPDLVNGRISHAQLAPVGRYRSYGKDGGPITMVPRQDVRVASAEIKPAPMFGIEEGPLIAALADRTKAAPDVLAKASSFRVIRVVSEIESWGYSDTINAYDGAGISLPPYHWAMAGTETRPDETSEVGGFASLFADLRAKGVVARNVFADLGLTATGGRAAGFGKYVGKLKFFDTFGKPRAMDVDGPKEFMPSWRSVYRWQQAGQRSADFPKAAWAFALKRLTTVFDTKVSVAIAACDKRRHAGGPTIGSIFTSELLMAMIVRWHVKAPDGVIRGDNVATDWIENAYSAAARAVSRLKPSTWTNANVWDEPLKVALLGALDDFLTEPENAKHKELTGNMADLATVARLDDEQIVVTVDATLRTLDGKFELAR